jgi:hypothetical protein
VSVGWIDGLMDRLVNGWIMWMDNSMSVWMVDWFVWINGSEGVGGVRRRKNW